MIDIVIVNWNAGTQLARCLQSIQRDALGASCAVQVIDNGSVDDSVEHAQALFPDVAFIRAGANLGFGKACNLGARQGRGEFILFLNPDAELRGDALGQAVATLRDPAHVRTGICGVQLIDEAGHVARSCCRLPNAARMAAHASGLTRRFPRLGYAMAEWPHTESRQVGHVIGAFYLVRRSLFEQLHGFDEQFFLYFEDLDFSCRAQQAGWATWYLATAQAFHAGGGTSRQIKARRLFYSLRSRLLYAHKHCSAAGAAGVALTTLWVEPLARIVQALARGSWPSIKETSTAYSMLWRWLLSARDQEPAP
ncbi:MULTISPECIES: glycosyltransferase family 2 protein [unclassified Acidovorax]|uniref:glycosyltransferase family 2 protein n=1 Tax=unclassified Acidovorax TaxID=2684926 RepID=UPI0028835800|nr:MULTISPECIES: glycosyltransferase family 2 protein [unclassified Acidovorax]